MNDAFPNQLRWWHYPYLMGLDLAAFAYLWALCFAKLLGVVLLNQEALILLVGSVWFCLIIGRLLKSFGQHTHRLRGFYSVSVPFFLLLLLCVALSLIWTFYYHVSVMLLRFTFFSAFFLIAQLMPGLRPYALFRKGCRAVAFAFACAIPAYYSCFQMNMLNMLFSPAIWCLAFLVFLVSLDQYRFEHSDGSALSLAQAGGQLLLLVLCFRFAYVVREVDEGIFFTLILANACLCFLGYLRSRLAETTLQFFRWPLIMVAPFLGLLLFM